MFFRRREEMRRLEAAESAGKSFWTDHFDDLVRRKLVLAMQDATSAYEGYKATVLARALLLRDEGVFTLSKRPDPVDDFLQFVLACDDNQLPSALEAFVAGMRGTARDWTAHDRLNDFVVTANRILLEHRVSFDLVEGQMVPFESKELHQEVVAPVLQLLAGRGGWEEVESAYQDALSELSHQKPADAVTDAARALQKALEASGADGNALGPLISSAKKRGILGPHDSILTDGIDKLMQWVSADRSRTGEPHHAGTEFLEDAWLAVHVVGALILRMTGERRAQH